MKVFWHLILKNFWHLNSLLAFSNLRNKHCRRGYPNGNKIFNLKWQTFVLITNGSILFAISSFAILIEEITSCADSGTKKKCCKKLTRKLERKSPRSYKRQMFEVKATLIGLHLRPFITGYNNGFKFFQNLTKVVKYWCISSKEFTFLVMSVFWNLDWFLHADRIRKKGFKLGSSWISLFFIKTIQTVSTFIISV